MVLDRSRIDQYNNLWWSIKENEVLDENTIVTTLYAVEDLFTREALFGKRANIDFEDIIKSLGSTDDELLRTNDVTKEVNIYKPNNKDNLVDQSLNIQTTKIGEIQKEAKKINLSEKLEEQLRRIYENYGFEIADGSNNQFSKMWTNLCTIYDTKRIMQTNKLSNAISFFFRGNQNAVNELISDDKSSLYKTNFYMYKIDEQNTIIKTELACKNDLSTLTTKDKQKEVDAQTEIANKEKKEKELQQKQAKENERGYTDGGIITNPNYNVKAYNKTFGNAQKESYLVEDDDKPTVTTDNYISVVLYNTYINNVGINNPGANFVNPNKLPDRREQFRNELFYIDKEKDNKQVNNSVDDFDDEDDEYGEETVRYKTDRNTNRIKQKTTEQNIADLKKIMKMYGFNTDKLKDDELLKDIVNKTTR
jgi:hypothetical protein